MTDKPLLDVKNLNISLKVDNSFISITEGVNFGINSGKVLALVGESGCGKSVTARAIMRLLAVELKIVEGEILFCRQNGETIDIAGLSTKDKKIQYIRGGEIAMIFQEPMRSFSPIHTIGNQLVETIRLHSSVSKKDAHKTATELLKKVGIAGANQAIDQYPGAFSGGMRQRAMIAKAISCNPLLLIADEPTTALDVTIQIQILNVMKDLKEELGMAIIFISHNMGVVAQIADDVAIMYMGRIIEKGDVHEIFKHPKHPYTVNLLRTVPRLGDLEARRRLVPIKGSVPSLFERPTGCPFGPRCEYFMTDKCDKKIPSLTQIKENHDVYCHLYN